MFVACIVNQLPLVSLLFEFGVDVNAIDQEVCKERACMFVCSCARMIASLYVCLLVCSRLCMLVCACLYSWSVLAGTFERLCWCVRTAPSVVISRALSSSSQAHACVYCAAKRFAPQQGSTALFLACWHGHDSIIHFLLERGADVTIIDFLVRGENPQTLCHQCNHSKQQARDVALVACACSLACWQ